MVKVIKQLIVEIDSNTYNMFQEKCKDLDISTSDLIKDIIENFLKYERIESD
jgi:hypothetical protein